MIVKVSNPMKKLINDLSDSFKCELVKMSIKAYEYRVDYNALEHENDYNYETLQFKALRIAYKSEFYACDRYLTTNDLVRIFRNSDKTYEGFKSELLECLEI